MTIVAKFASVCPGCGKPIVPGQQVEWERGQKARHTDCDAVTQAAQGPRSITVVREGRRSYIGGDTIAVRGILKNGGCHWDDERRQWWIGDHAAAEALAERARAAPAEQAPTPAPRRRGRPGKWTGCSCGSREDSHGDLIPSARNCFSCRHDS